MTTRDHDTDGEGVEERAPGSDGGRGSGDRPGPPGHPGGKRAGWGRAGPRAASEGSERLPEGATGDGDGTSSVRRRTLLRGLGSGAIVTGLAGCQTDEPGRTEVRRTRADEPGTTTDDTGGRTETSGDPTETPEGRTETSEDPTETSGDPTETSDDPTETPDGGPQTETQCFETTLDCPDPCTGRCELRIEFTYDFERADDGTVSVSRFRMEFVETTSDGGNCSPEFGTGRGTFEFEVAGEQPCSVDRQAVFECECGMTVQFEDRDPDDGEDCVCPDFQQIPIGACGEPVWFEKTGDFESITVDFQQDVTCGCRGQQNTGTIDVQIRFRDGEISFGGDTADC